MSATIIDNDLVISGLTPNKDVKIYIDRMSNYKNAYSAESNKHTLEITRFNIIELDIYINLDLLLDLDLSAFTLNVDGMLGFYFDKNELYNKQIELLTTSCSTCLDKEQKERMVLFMMKWGLLTFAEKEGLVEDTIRFYNDIARMLNIDVELDAQTIQRSSNCVGIKCTGNTCQVCRN